MGSGFSKQKVKVLVVGLDGSGKTSILQFLRNTKQTINEVAPTVGYNVETFDKNNLNFTFIDMSGQNQYRDMWEQYAKQIDALVFVIDSTDQLRFSIMANELDLLFSYADIKNRAIPILFYCNKIDDPKAEQPKFFIDYMKLDQINDRSWQVIGSSTVTGEGLNEGLLWLSNKLQVIKKK